MSANGELKDSELVTVQPGIRLTPATARQFNAAKAAAARDGVSLTIVQSFNGAGGYRSRAVQLDMRARPKLYGITPGVTPGLPSDHGWGTQVDIAGGLDWLIKNGERYGFIRNKLAFKDYNHFGYNGTTVTASTGATPISAEEAKEMFTLFNIPNEGIWVRSLITGNRAHVQTPYHVSLLQRYRVENDTMLGAECDIVTAYLSAINPGAGTVVQDQLRRDLGSIRGGDVEMSLTKIAAAVAAVKAPTLTPEQLAAIGKAIAVPTPPTKFVITGEAHA